MKSDAKTIQEYLANMPPDRRKANEKVRETGKRYDVGKSCVRFRKLDDLPLPVIADSIRSLEMDEFISRTKGLSAPRAKNKQPKDQVHEI